MTKLELDWNFNYGELANHQDVVNKYENLKQNLMKVEEVLNRVVPMYAHYDNMSLSEKVDIDLFLAYTLNSLYWIKLRVIGVDPNKHPIKNELMRIKAVLAKWQKIKQRHLRPTVNVGAVKRFMRSGLYDPYKNMGQPAAKKIKFNDYGKKKENQDFKTVRTSKL